MIRGRRRATTSSTKARSRLLSEVEASLQNQFRFARRAKVPRPARASVRGRNNHHTHQGGAQRAPLERETDLPDHPRTPAELAPVLAPCARAQDRVLATWQLWTGPPASVSAETIALWYYWRWRNNIYQSSSKYQWIFWPLTDTPTVYTCKKCYLSAFMWGFEKLPKGKLPAIRKQLEGLRLDYDLSDYAKIPVARRLKVAEKVYAELGQDDEFWCSFYRTLGYHFDREEDPAGADEARSKALSICQKMLSDRQNAGIRKELLLISGAMKHFLRDGQGALADSRLALELKYQSNELKEEENQNADKNLSALLKEYLKKVQSPDKPRLKQLAEDY